jgi:hypothetical protein
MVAPLVIAGLAAAAGAGLRGAGASAQADAMMPEEWREYLAQLESGPLGLTPAQQAAMEADHTAMRGGAIADAQAHQLRQAALGSGAWGNARDLFLQDLATQQAQGQMMNEQTKQIQQAELAMQKQNRAMMMELQQRQASADAAKKKAWLDAGADIFSIFGEAGMGVAGAGALQTANEQLLEAAALGDAVGVAEAQERANQAQMDMYLAYGYAPRDT